MNLIGTTVRGIRAPIIREGDNLVDIVTNTIYEVSKEIPLKDGDIIAITESVVARAQGNYATTDDIAIDIQAKFGENAIIGVVHPILSRNRFAICLKGIAKAAKKIIIMFSFPSDEVGNKLMLTNDKTLSKIAIMPFQSSLDLETFKNIFGEYKHRFTGVNYIEYYKNIVEEAGAECEIIFSNCSEQIFKYTSKVIDCSIHKPRLKGDQVYSLANILSVPNNFIFAYNTEYGLLGSNKVSEDKIKLFPRDCFTLVNEIQKKFIDQYNYHPEVMIYGDGAFKDPTEEIWELADPVVCPGYTNGLKGTPNELKLKYLADNQFADFNGKELQDAIIESIKQKTNNLVGNMNSQGTTPRKYVDLIGSLCDLTSGSGDKGTPFILIQNYFDNYSNI